MHFRQDRLAQHQSCDHRIECGVVHHVARRFPGPFETVSSAMSYGRQSLGSCGHSICTIHTPRLRRISEEDLGAREENEQTETIDTIPALGKPAAPTTVTATAIGAAQEGEEAIARASSGGIRACKAAVGSRGDLHRGSWRTDHGARAVSPR